MKFRERRCPECGEGMVRLVAKPGRRAPELLAIAQRALEKLEQAAVRQSDVERAIGLSAGYLSKIKRGERTQLAMIAMDPKARLSEAQNVWASKLAS